MFARLIVLASVPFVEGRGAHILTFMQHFAANINKHLMPLWDQRIPLLLHYLETHANFGEGASNAWVQVDVHKVIKVTRLIKLILKKRSLDLKLFNSMKIFQQYCMIKVENVHKCVSVLIISED